MREVYLACGTRAAGKSTFCEKAVALDQETALGDLLVRWTGGDGEAQPRVTDEFDRPPEAPEQEEKKA